MSIFKNEIYLNPKYAYLDKYVNIMLKGAWTPAKYEKLIKEQDVPYYFNEMDLASREAVRRCILAVATVEDRVKAFWSLVFLDFPQTIISDISGVFANSEVVHRRSYHSLVENLKIDLKEIETQPALQGRIAYLNKHLEKDPKIIGKKHILKKIVLFTALVERISLFTQFYILMSFSAKKKELNTISALQQTTAKEEIIHYSLGLDLVNEIKSENPEIWDEYLQDLIKKNIKDAYSAELNLINWFFENGVPSHLSKDEVLNFLNFNFSEVAKDLKLGLNFDYDKEIFKTKNKWFLEETLNTIEPDFFDNAVGGYSSEDELVDIDNFKF
jgi:ribonucleoside-diphosphate reductase beta chain